VESRVESAVVAAEEAVSEAVAAVAEAVAAVAAAVEERRRGAAEAAVTDTALAEISEVGVEAEIAEIAEEAEIAEITEEAESAEIAEIVEDAEGTEASHSGDVAARAVKRVRRLEPWEGKKEAISLPVFFLGPRAFPTRHFRSRVASRDVLSDRLPRKGSSGASLGDVPLAIGQPRQQLTSSAACEEPEAGVSCRMSHSSARCQCKNAFAPRQLGARPACFPACARASQSSGGPGILALPFIHSR
jgi:hypothetical protein